MFDRMILSLARHFLFAGTKLFFGIGEGPSSGQTTAANNISNLGAFDTTEGQNVLGTGLGDISTATNFWDAILSGDPSRISGMLGPEFSAIAGQAQQGIDAAGQFGNRSGGTNAAIQNTTNSVRAADTSLVGNLIGAAATNVGNLGTNLATTGTNILGQGLSADTSAFGAQTQLHNETASMWNDIFNSIGQVAKGVVGGFNGGTGGSGGSGGFSDAASIDASASGGYGPGNVANSDVALPPPTFGVDSPMYY